MTGQALTGAGVLAGLILWWWQATPVFAGGGWPEMTETAAALHGAALWWVGHQLIVLWRRA